MAKPRNAAEKEAERIKHRLATQLRANRIRLDQIRRNLDAALDERLALIELAYKSMDLDEIGEHTRLTKQRVSKILAARQQEGQKDG